MSGTTNFNSLPADTLYKILENMAPRDIISMSMSSKVAGAFSGVFGYLSQTSDFFQKDLRNILKEMNIISKNETYTVRSIFEEAMKMESQFKEYFPEFTFMGTLTQRCKQIHEKIPQMDIIRTFSMFRKAAAKGQVQSIMRVLQEKSLLTEQKSRGLYSASNGGHLLVVQKLLQNTNIPKEGIDSALRAAKKRKHSEIEDLLQKNAKRRFEE